MIRNLILTMFFYIGGIVVLKIVAQDTNLFHVSDLVFCVGYILGGVKVLVEEFYE